MHVMLQEVEAELLKEPMRLLHALLQHVWSDLGSTSPEHLLHFTALFSKCNETLVCCTNLCKLANSYL